MNEISQASSHSVMSISEFDMLATADIEGAYHRVLVSLEYRAYGWIVRYQFGDNTAPTEGEMQAIALNTSVILNKLRVLQLREKQVQALNKGDKVLINMGNHKSPTKSVYWNEATFITFIDDNIIVRREGWDELISLSRYCVKVLGGD